MKTLHPHYITAYVILALVFAAFVTFLVVYSMSPWTIHRGGRGVGYRNSTNELVIINKSLDFEGKRPFVLDQKIACSMRRTWIVAAAWFRAIHVPCILAYGSLLGYARHDRQFIPWDDDIDVHVPVQYESVVFSAAARGVAKTMNLELFINSEGILKVYLRKYAHMSFPFVDVFFLGGVGPDGSTTTLGAEMLCNVHPASISSLKNVKRMVGADDRWKTDDVFPLQAVEFEGASCFAPTNIPLALAGTFGGATDTLTKVVVPGAMDQFLHNHRIREFFLSARKKQARAPVF